MKNFIRIIMVLLLSLTLLPFAQAQTFVKQDYGNDNIEGLAYINNKAKQFINQYNQQHHTNWQSLEPSAKVIVPKCAVPLKAKWEKVILGDDHIPHKYVIAVYCEKMRDPKQKKWSVRVQVCDEQSELITSIK
ncbi:hypothetical protein A9G11_09500 [Gilliamella sp. wkB108]|uniref:hypothetical protein n=1 Tax=Gilliamella sp. wkB108 TaxID=3120256 RepID=UPI00080D9C36|nr:hypothetical protein [Gilliamella apicola]OCG20920.1 hypothetical protein A9G11_09500 [Gilliamella apicola]